MNGACTRTIRPRRPAPSGRPRRGKRNSADACILPTITPPFGITSCASVHPRTEVVRGQRFNVVQRQFGADRRFQRADLIERRHWRGMLVTMAGGASLRRHVEIDDGDSAHSSIMLHPAAPSQTYSPSPLPGSHSVPSAYTTSPRAGGTARRAAGAAAARRGRAAPTLAVRGRGGSHRGSRVNVERICLIRQLIALSLSIFTAMNRPAGEAVRLDLAADRERDGIAPRRGFVRRSSLRPASR